MSLSLRLEDGGEVRTRRVMGKDTENSQQLGRDNKYLTLAMEPRIIEVPDRC